MKNFTKWAIVSILAISLTACGRRAPGTENETTAPETTFTEAAPETSAADTETSAEKATEKENSPAVTDESDAESTEEMEESSSEAASSSATESIMESTDETDSVQAASSEETQEAGASRCAVCESMSAAGASEGGMAAEAASEMLCGEKDAEARQDCVKTMETEPEPSPGVARYTDANGDTAYIPAGFAVSQNAREQSIRSGLVVIGPDGSEFVWIPTTVTPLQQRDFGSYFGGGTIASFYDETELPLYQEMVQSTAKYGGFYIGRYEASFGGGSSKENYVPASKRIASEADGRIWVQFSPQDTVIACQNLYADNPTVQGFFPWGANWDTVLQWLVDSGNKTAADVGQDSSAWGNYSNDTFSVGARGQQTGVWEEANSNNIYDLAGNNWEWTQERAGGGNYVMRSGGYNLMGGECPGSRYPAAIRDPLPGNDHHPNVTFRIGLFVR